MASVLLFLGVCLFFWAAYATYARYLETQVFQVDPSRITPSREVNDGVDYVPTRTPVLFGHHFTSIAGTGPIVGPAIAMFWGWLPALLWIALGAVFIGAVHDYGSLMVSLRSRGQTIGDAAGRMVNPRMRLLFLVILFFTLTVVIAMFALVIATIFAQYPQSVLSVWGAMPLAVFTGWWIYRRNALLMPTIVSLILLYALVALGVVVPVNLSEWFGIPLLAGSESGILGGLAAAVPIWSVLLLIYCYCASVLPVWLLLQPRDYINSNQLYVALAALISAILVVRPEMVAPALQSSVADAPPIAPFLFITIACGAISGFHCLVSSGTTSKQISSETAARPIAYGGMLLEGVLALLVLIVCGAGIGLGVVSGNGTLTGAEAWHHLYGNSWKSMQLAQILTAFIEGGGNLLVGIGIPRALATNVLAVMVACFAATTIDTATRLHRYIIQELGNAVNLRALTNKYTATLVSVGAAGLLAFWPGPKGVGSGAMILWPLFGATNQLLAGLALIVIAYFLHRYNRPVVFVVVPLLIMLAVPGWALALQIVEFWTSGNTLLLIVGALILALQVWMALEAIAFWRTTKGVPPEPPRITGTAAQKPETSSGLC